MGRKSSTTKNAEKAHVMVEPQTGNENKKVLECVDSQLENQQPWFSPVDGMGTGHERSPARDQVNPEFEQQKHSATLKRKKSKYSAMTVRRSERIKSGVVHPSNHVVECIGDVNVIESEKDEPGTQIEEVLPEPEPEPELEPETEPEENFCERSLNEKVDYAFQRIESLEKIVESLKSKVDENMGSDETPPLASFSHRTMYFDSQKKIEALTDENQRLTGKLENALGKIEVYEKENRVMLEVLDKMKDAVNAAVISNLTKTTEAAVNASAQAIRNACSTSAAKRKRNAQET